MSTVQIASLFAIILAFAFVDVFCGDVTNVGQANPWHVDQTNLKPQEVSGGKSTTAWPALGQRWTERPPLNNNGPAQGPKKWIQQNNLWIRNEQGILGGNNRPNNVQAGLGNGPSKPVDPSQLKPSGQSQNIPRGTVNSQNSNLPVDKTVSTTPKSLITPSSKAPAFSTGLNRGPVQVLPNVVNTTPKTPSTTTKSSFLSWFGFGGKKSTTPSLPGTTTSKPGSYAGAVTGSLGTSIAKPISTTPKSSLPPISSKPGSYASAVGGKASVSPPVVPKNPTTPKNTVHGDDTNALSAGLGDFGGNQQVDEKAPDTSDTTDDELRQFSEALIKKDTNNAMRYVTLQLQGMTSSRSMNDEAPLPLLKVDPSAYQIPSIEKLMLLYNNYILESNQNEIYTAQERIEENNLLDTMLATPVMQFARSFLIQKGKVGRDPREFRDLLKVIWFNMYSRGQGRIGSSGFEHVFLAEIKNKQVSGLHNWLYFNEEEAKQHANYLGYMRKIDLGQKGAIVKYHFRFNDIDKPVGSMFIGTSPELEVALYSTCFILRADKPCPLKMDGNRFVIRTYTYRYRGKNMIGSAFPEI
ncbi:uncharacterized protein LOC143196511 [Rhynchophorus ferrugineus]|uniref:uncharacterized protein LOC143196511 n=1 Tax=Rhynchophorus ferrugineus TaxID=354439 RepID=UPI003FCC322D